MASTPIVHDRPASQNIAGFDGLRAIAVLIVLIAHAGLERLVPGGTGVTIFFVISGFLITRLLLHEIERSGTIDFKQFYIRRFLRLAPELLALVLLCSILGLIFSWQVLGIEVGAAVLYYMNYYTIFVEGWSKGAAVGILPGATTPPWRHLWSLAVEEHFYFLWPATLLFALRRGKALGVLLAAVCLPLVWRYITFNVIGLGSDYNYMATDARIDSIAIGSLAAYLLHRRSRTNSEATAAQPFVGLWIMGIALVALFASLVIRGEEFRWVYRFSIQNVSLFFIMINLLYDPRWKWAVNLLELPFMRWIGRISYGLYLYHMAVNKLLAKLVPAGPKFMLASILLSILVASLSFVLLEKPIKPLRRRFGSHVR